MAFKSLIIFALVASAGRVMTAPLAGMHLGARNSCSGSWCARHVAGDEHSGLARRLADFGGDNVTLSSPSGGSSLNPSTTSVVLPLSTLSDEPSSTPPLGSIPTGSPSPSVSSIVDQSTDGTPQPTQSPPEGPVTITVVSTVFLSATEPPAGLPTQSPAPSDSVVSSSLGTDTSLTVPGVPASSVPPNPSSTIPASGVISSSPSLLEPSGFFSSVSQPQPSIFTTLDPVSNNVPSSTVSSSNPADQPASTPTGIIFLPPA